jgi:neutral ceramidase
MTRRLLLLTLAAGCAHSPTFAGSPAPPLPTAPREARPFTVGVARADITPPPGAATFGHGPDAHLAMGYWTRLECRAFVFSSGPTPAEQLAIVPCDLPAMGHLLHRMVAQRVEALLPASRLMLTATHTHAGTAHYLESQAFGGATSTRWPGFDPRMAEFLADRIAAAIREAFGARAPARLRWVHGEVWGLTRNRSLDAYRLDDPPYLAADAGVERPFDERAIDPALDVLQLQRQDDGGTLGWLVFFAMHPTVLPASNRLFGGDVYGVATRALEEAVGGGAVVASSTPTRATWCRPR